VPDGCGTFRFDRREFAGSLGDLGTLLPIAIGLVVINGLDPTAVFLCVGLFYVLSGLYFRITVPVQPMKVIGAYAIARVLAPIEISSAGLLLGVLLLVLALSGTIKLVGRLVPKSCVRGVQLTTGILLFTQGVRFILGTSSLQAARGAAEPFLSVATLGPLPIGIVLGCVAVLLILLLLDNRYAPAALVVVVLGAGSGLVLGAWKGLSVFELGLHLPAVVPYGWPTLSDMALALTALALPQLPMTLGNAVVAQADLTREYFGPACSRRMSFRALALSMGLANLVVAFFGGMPLCHGAGGLAAHYRFGARSAGSNLMIGGVFVLIALVFGDQAIALLSLLPFSVLGALLLFAGAQLAMTILDIDQRADMFVIVAMLGASLVTNLGIGFGLGLVLAYLFKSGRFRP